MPAMTPITMMATAIGLPRAPGTFEGFAFTLAILQGAMFGQKSRGRSPAKAQNAAILWITQNAATLPIA